ncbi:MAG: hypothetical protein PSV17_09525 [Methylotenera sp.]|uniref:hypothetical protein n=1 Tax=Methylotenera sp. TaxID=2051956 RepID=UPI0024872B29|nr:hypothetical protein [Methylotenera sp.]MDI1309656.1 hypothetical protein [Methylotenera sp.]
MTKLLAIVLLTLGSVSTGQVLAAETTNTDVVPPAHIQKNEVPDSTANGNYLEPQPDENGATTNTTDKQKRIQMNSKPKGSNATNLEKSKRLTETPEDGGTKVNP